MYQPVGMSVTSMVFARRKVMQGQHESKTRILDASLQVLRAKGFAATTVDDVCRAAGLTKGSFFHHFDSKEALALAAAEHFAVMADRQFAHAPYRSLRDPLDRLLGYIDFRKAMLRGSLPEFTCLLGMMVQESFESHPAIREACNQYISAHAGDVAKDIAEAKHRYTPNARWTAESLGLYTQAVVQGAFVLAKAKNGPKVASDSLDHLKRYLQLLFNPSKSKRKNAHV
jgi:TetR/AcrR family transcriptional regulator, transcriptional repressor for nem operon